LSGLGVVLDGVALRGGGLVAMVSDSITSFVSMSKPTALLRNLRLLLRHRLNGGCFVRKPFGNPI
ncbi:hypothetical protein TELCIR_20586, partial [Teladorsagia circumcincta]